MPRSRKHGSNAGRPEMGGYVTVPLGAERKDAVAAWAARHGVRQAEALRRLLDAGLAATDAAPEAGTQPAKIP